MEQLVPVSVPVLMPQLELQGVLEQPQELVELQRVVLQRVVLQQEQWRSGREAEQCLFEAWEEGRSPARLSHWPLSWMASPLPPG